MAIWGKKFLRGVARRTQSTFVTGVEFGEIFRGATQNSSNELDRRLGTKVEDLEKPWIEWLAKRMGRTVQKRVRPRKGTWLEAQLPRGFQPGG